MKSIITLNGEVPFEIEKGCRMVNAAGKEFLVVKRLTTTTIEVKPYRWYHKLWRWLTRRRPTGFTVLQVILFFLGSLTGNLLFRWWNR